MQTYIFTYVLGGSDRHAFEAIASFASWSEANTYAEKIMRAYESHGCSSVTVEVRS